MESRSKKPVVFSVILLVVIVAVIVTLVLTLGQTKKNQGISQAQLTTNKQQIEGNWKTFFAAATPQQTREDLLEDGSQFTQSIQSEFQALGTQKSAAVITNVSNISATSANVTYNVQLNGQTVLSNQQGKAVFVNGKWKVSKDTFCQLLKMGGAEPAACKNVTGA